MNEDTKCKTHPDAPHGFVRDASITEDRYVCECEYWEPPEEDIVFTKDELKHMLEEEWRNGYRVGRLDDNSCRKDGRCQYAIDHGAEGLGACPPGKCCMPAPSEQEPVGYFSVNDYGNWEQNENGIGEPFYTAPPKREWVGLTDVEWMNIVNKDHAWFGQRPEDVAHEVAKLVEAKLKEKNT